MDFIGKYIVSSIFVGFGVFLLFIIHAPSRKKNYNVVSAKIMKSDKYTSTNTRQGHGMKYGVTLEYEYLLDGKKHINNTIFKNADSFVSSDPTWASQFAKEYPEGKGISVFVNKDNPSDAYILEKSPGTLFFTFLAMLAVVGGVLIWYFN